MARRPAYARHYFVMPPHFVIRASQFTFGVEKTTVRPPGHHWDSRLRMDVGAARALAWAKTCLESVDCIRLRSSSPPLNPFSPCLHAPVLPIFPSPHLPHSTIPPCPRLPHSVSSQSPPSPFSPIPHTSIPTPPSLLSSIHLFLYSSVLPCLHSSRATLPQASMSPPRLDSLSCVFLPSFLSSNSFIPSCADSCTR